MDSARRQNLLVTGACVLVAGFAWLCMGVPMTPRTPGGDDAAAAVLAQLPLELGKTPGDEQKLQQLVGACKTAGEGAIPRLWELAESPDPAVAGNALRALGRLRAVHPDDKAARLLADPRQRVSHETILALGNSGDQSATAMLEPIVRSGDAQSRLLAVQSLSRLGASDALQRLAGDPAVDANTRTFIRTAARPLRVPQLVATTAGLEGH